MVGITEVLSAMFPNGGYRLRDDGKGPFISEWLNDVPQPTQEQIDAASPQVELALAKAKLASERWTRESAGIIIGTQFVSTNRDEMPVWQGMLLDAFVLRPGVRSAFEYKPRGGQNTTLTPQQVGRCYECFAWYVAALFAVERQVAAMLEATTSNAEREAILSAIQWPQREFTWEVPT